jgi:hypothetical protein
MDQFVKPYEMGPKIPGMLRPLFWDYEFETLNWEDDQDLIIQRILTSGNWDTLVWLRSRVGDCFLRDWIIQRQGAGLGTKRLRFWELVLGLPHRQVNAWLLAGKRKIWEERTNP